MNLEKRVKRLEVTIVILAITLVASMGFTVYGITQMLAFKSSIPSYKEIKEDVKQLKGVYNVTKEKAPKVYNYTKEKVSDGYDYTKDKVNGVIDYFKSDSDTDSNKK